MGTSPEERTSRNEQYAQGSPLGGVRGLVVVMKPGNAGGAKGTRKREGMQFKRRDYTPVTVPFAATPAGEPPSVEMWANSTVWTECMLTALRNGVRGGRWHTLYDKVWKLTNLYAAARHVIENEGAAGVDHVTVKDFDQRLSDEVRQLSSALCNKSYKPQQVRRTLIAKLGSKEKRPLGIPTVRDRVVQTALLHVLEPIFDVTFHEHSYGFRRGRGCHHALERVEALLNAGHTFVVDADLKSYFDTIPHDRLLKRVAEQISDSSVLALVGMFLQQGVFDGLQAWTPEEGTPQGGVISPLLANIYLNPLDYFLHEQGFELVRYADDFVVLCRTRAEAEQALELIRQWVTENDLTLHPTKTRIADANDQEGFAFLGYVFKKGRIREPREKSLKKLKTTLKAKTPRQSGHSLDVIIRDVNTTLRGWMAYFRHCHWSEFRDLDGWLRDRLRAILRKRAHRRGRARLRDRFEWLPAFFTSCGLVSLSQLHSELCQSCLR